MAERREQRRAGQADGILKAARKLFAQLGPENVTMADVAREAGVARATVFNHFGSKHALVESITEEVLTGYVLLLDEALADDESPSPDLVRRAFEYMGRGIEEDRRFYRGVFREIAKLSLGLDEGGPGQRTRQEALVRLEKLLTRGQARGELSAEHRPEDLATAFDSLVFGTITHWLYDDASEPLHRRMQRAAEVFLGAVALGGAPAKGRRLSPPPTTAARSRSPRGRPRSTR
jgi:AcrR family transcriptional regulator